MEDRPRYNNSRCFETFPFPVATPEQTAHIAALAEQLDAHRKRVLAERDDLTLTGLYNVLEKRRAGQPLNAKEKSIHERGLVAVLLSLHDELDAAVFKAYGWDDLAQDRARGERDIDAPLLERLVALNAERAAEEAAGTVRWLRPEFQCPGTPTTPPPADVQQTVPGIEVADAPPHAPPQAARKPHAPATTPAPRGAGSTKTAWPATLPEQMAAVAQALATSAAPLTLDALADHFTGRGKWKARLPQILETLVALGRARRLDDGRFGAER